MELFSLLKNRNILSIYVGLNLSSIGDWFFRIALPLIVYKQTNSPFYVILTVISSTLPFFIFAPFGGVIADRCNRRAILLFSDFMRAMIFFTMALSPSSWMVNVVIVGGFFVAIFDRFFSPALSAAMPNLVELKKMPALNSLFSMTGTFIKLTVPPIAAMIVGTLGVRSALIINSVSFFTSMAGCLLADSSVFLVLRQNGKLTMKNMLFDMKEGVIALLGEKLVLSVLIMWMIVWLGSAPYTTLLVVFVKDVLKLSDSAFGIMSSVNGLGMLVGGWFAIWLCKKADIWRVFVVGLAIIAVGAFVFAFSQDFTVASIGRFIAGFGSIIASVAEITIVQTQVPLTARGRVLAFSDVALQGVSIISMGMVSLLIVMVSIRVLFYISAVIFGITAVVAYFLKPIVSYEMRSDREFAKT